jgi:glycosyltransferase involved in cell wall biosynthesis
VSISSPAPRVSVIMSFRDADTTLRATVASLLWQTERNWELIAVDDGSRDDVCFRELQRCDPRIKALRYERSAGLPTRLNECVRLARGRYIARMDADDLALAHRLRTQADFLDAHAEVDLVAASMLVIDEADELLGSLPCIEAHEAITARPWLAIPMPHPTWMGRSGWFKSHPYDELALKSQDQDLLYRTYAGSRLAGIADPLLAYRHAPLSLRKSLAQRYYFLRAVWKFGPAMDALKSSAWHAIAAARDVIAVSSRTSSVVLRRRLRAATEEQVEQWRQVRAALAGAPLALEWPCAG